MKVAVQEVEDTARAVIRGYGYEESEVAPILDVMMYAQLRGNNQGVVKLIGPGIPRSAASVPMVVEHDTPLSALLNGGGNHAMVVLAHAVRIAWEKAEVSGIGLVGVNHISTSSGAIGFYARAVAANEMVGIVFAGATPTVAAEGSYEPIFGTNPLAVALPCEKGPVVLDMATAAIPFFGVIEAKTAGRTLPADIAYDRAGALTTDPTEAIQGSLRTFDRGPKGSGLSFIVQALTGPLVGAAYAGIGDLDTNWGGHLILAIDPVLLGGREALHVGVGAMIERVKATKRRDGVAEIFVPGERGDRLAEEAHNTGEMEIEDNLYEELLRRRRELGT